MSTLLSLLIPLAAAFGPDGAAPLPPSPELPSYGGLLLRTLIALLVVLVLAWVFLRWGLRRLLPGGATQGPLRVLGRLPLDGRRAVVLVEAAGRFLLLGVADGSVSLLSELEPEAVKAALDDAKAAQPKRFAEVLRERLGRQGATQGQGGDPSKTGSQGEGGQGASSEPGPNESVKPGHGGPDA
ncbi:MAG: flagellar biosynthetic protein FliO [Polyangia bacterium]|jgi:flagellar biosynthetic protein FliO|nr:flagellar biosynthetic protein FliO [Polyangia bacterium]